MERYIDEKSFSEVDSKKNYDTDSLKSDELWIKGEYLDLKEYDNHKTIKYGCFQCAGGGSDEGGSDC